MKRNIIFVLLFGIALSVSAMAPSVYASDPGTVNPADPGTVNPSDPGTTNPADPGTANTQNTGTIANPLKVDSLEALLGIVLDAVIKLGAIILTIALIWCGFLFVAARGNEEKISKARVALMWTVIGGLILLGAKGIQAVLVDTVNSVTS